MIGPKDIFLLSLDSSTSKDTITITQKFLKDFHEMLFAKLYSPPRQLVSFWWKSDDGSAYHDYGKTVQKYSPSEDVGSCALWEHLKGNLHQLLQQTSVDSVET